jgi:hypothetical protein
MGSPAQKAYYADPLEIRAGESSGMELLDRSHELVSESTLMTPVFGDRKIYDFIPVQKMETGPLAPGIHPFQGRIPPLPIAKGVN